MQLLKDPCPGSTTLSDLEITLRSEETLIFVLLSSLIFLKELIIELEELSNRTILNGEKIIKPSNNNKGIDIYYILGESNNGCNYTPKNQRKFS